MAWATPVIHSVGDILTASDWNIGSNDLSFLFGDATWTSATLLNSWVASGTGPQYMLIGRTVCLRGAATNTSSSAAVFTLPAGYRPSLDIHVAGIQSTSVVSVDISAAGNVALLVAGTSLHLDGISFPIV